MALIMPEGPWGGAAPAHKRAEIEDTKKQINPKKKQKKKKK
ncbi:hypothetical protein [Streptomyces microflavus]